jgi:hypothetical protein
MDDLEITEQPPNLNSATIAGKLIKVEPLTGKTPGLSLTIGYTKTWPNGGTQEIPIRCYVTGAERVEKYRELKPGAVILVHGEVTDKNAIYAHQLEWLSHPPRAPSKDDAYLAGMSRA